MKILLVNIYHYVRGGSETYYFGLAELLKQAGHEVIFFAMQDKQNISCEQNKYFVSNIDFNASMSLFQKIKAAFRMVYSLEARKKFKRLLEDEKPDIIHINLFHRVLTASIIDIAKKMKIPVVFTMHDLNCICPNHTMLDHGNICEACLHGNYINCLKRICFKESRAKCFMATTESYFNKITGLYNKIDLYITPSEFYRKKLLESNLTKSPIICLRNFLPLNTTFQRHENGNYYLYFGRLSKEKGIKTLLKAIKMCDNIRLEIAGTGPEEENLLTYVKINGLQNRVHFNGFLSGEALKKIVYEAKCIVLPSEWYENGPYSIMEAMAAGKPVIVSDLGGLPEIVVNGQTGFIYKAFNPDSLKDCIDKVELLSSEEISEMQTNAIIFAKQEFNADNYIQNIIKLYRRIQKERQS